MDLSRCKNLKEIPDLSKATNLEELNFSGCESLKEIPDLSNAFYLREMNLSGCKSLKEIPDLSKATNLEELNLSGCKSLKEIPDLSKAINLKKLDLSGCESLKEIPDLPKSTKLKELNLENCTSLKKLSDSVQNLEELTNLDMSGCTSLEELPTNINLVSLTFLNFCGCSRLTSFPQLSTSTEVLVLSDTAIEEVPSWIENIDELTHLFMRGCEKLKEISASIWNLKHLEYVDFTDCGGVTSLSDASLVKTVAELREEMYLSYSDSDTELLFHHSNSYTQFLFCNCFNLDQDAQKFILQSYFRYAILPGKKVPTYFTHRTLGSCLTVPLPRSSLSQNNFRFTACFIPNANPATDFQYNFGNITVHWKFRGVEDAHEVDLGMVSAKMDNLVVFHFNILFQEDPPSQLDCENVEFEFKYHYTSGSYLGTTSLLPIKECGVRVLDVSPSLDASDRSSEAEYTDQSEESDEESRRSKKRMQMTVEPSQVHSNLPGGKTAVNSGSMAPCLEEEARSSEESGRSKKRMQMTVTTSQEPSNSLSLCGQTGVNLALSLGLVRNKVPSPSTSSRNFYHHLMFSFLLMIRVLMKKLRMLIP